MMRGLPENGKLMVSRHGRNDSAKINVSPLKEGEAVVLFGLAPLSQHKHYSELMKVTNWFF